jgi:hypothetical protein
LERLIKHEIRDSMLDLRNYALCCMDLLTEPITLVCNFKALNSCMDVSRIVIHPKSLIKPVLNMKLTEQQYLFTTGEGNYAILFRA